MNFRKINLITGWLVCLVACTVFIMTTEAGGSFWDCGEFVSSCFKVQIPHPPGAPLFVLLGRIFIILFGDDGATAAKAVNIMNALASGFTILFLFWTITHFARKIVQTDISKALTNTQIWGIMAAGIVGALAGTFTDSFWYSAVEGEVYAMSSFFTAIVFWGILKWENVADEPGADKWIVFIFFMIGLSIGVHLLCLLCIPAIVVAYYFRRRNTFSYALLRKYFIWTIVIGGAAATLMALIGAQSATTNDIPMDGTVAGLMIMGTIVAIALLYLVERIKKENKEYYGGLYIFMIFGFILLGIVQIGVIQYSIKAAGRLDIIFVNSFGMPFFSGFSFFFVVVAILIWLGLRFSARKGWPYLRLALWCIAFTLIGYSTYFTTLLRSNADPAVDMYNVDNPQSLAGYLGREQYGDFPILYGQKFTAQPEYEKGPVKYQKGKDRYIESGTDIKYVYRKEDKMVFPRMWDASNDQNHADYYASFMGIGKSQDGTYERGPTFMDNIKFFLSYQTYFMYIRYFLWNFSGKQDDIQGLFTGNVRDGNWISGIPLIDNALYGDQSMLPDSLKENKAHNAMYMLPFILGLVGFLYHYRRKGDDALVNFLLFFFTGFAIVIYLNQPGFQPRERDYAYAGSFYAYAVWIGLSVLYFIEMASSWNKKLLQDVLISGGIIAFIFMLSVVIAGYTGGLIVGISVFALIALVAGGIPYVLKFIGNQRTITFAALIISLLVPLLMGAQEWDDHDRSKKQLPRDMARDYLESCAPNAILFTFGDNDTYPLWYAQEVEGIRPDIRVINTSLLGIDWYINQLRYKVNQSDSIDVIWNAAQIEGNKRDYLVSKPEPPENRYWDLYSMMKYWAGSDDPDKMLSNGEDQFNTFPSHKVSIPVDIAMVRANGTVNPGDSVATEMRFDIPPKSYITKNDLAMLNIIAANKWKRPICFTMPYGELGFGDYLRREGLAFRLVPVKSDNANAPYVNTNGMFKLVMNHDIWRSGNADLPNVYFDEENRRHLNDIRKADTDLAFDLIFKNKKDSATKVLERTDNMMLQENFPYGMTSRYNDHNKISMGFLEACYEAGDQKLAAKVLASVKKDLQQQERYYNSLSSEKADNMDTEKRINAALLQQLTQMEKVYSPGKPSTGENGRITDTVVQPREKDNTQATDSLK